MSRTLASSVAVAGTTTCPPSRAGTGLAQALGRFTPNLRYADPLVYFGLPDVPGVGARQTLDQVATTTLEQLKDFPFRRLIPQPGQP